MTSRAAIATRTGLLRRRNEDSGYVGRWLCVVADGMGGHAGGDTASAAVIDAVVRVFRDRASGLREDRPGLEKLLAARPLRGR
jgi:serine/threonine protein phosphatase PrpC